MTLSRSLLQGVGSLAAGTVFGLGLAVAQMTDPGKVLSFLDITGAWDGSLLFVLGAAVVFAAVAFHIILRRPSPLFDSRFHLPKVRLDRCPVDDWRGHLWHGLGHCRLLPWTSNRIAWVRQYRTALAASSFAAGSSLAGLA